MNGSVQSIRTDGPGSKSILCGLETPDNLVIAGNYIVVNVGQGILRIDR